MYEPARSAKDWLACITREPVNVMYVAAAMSNWPTDKTAPLTALKRAVAVSANWNMFDTDIEENEGAINRDDSSIRKDAKEYVLAASPVDRPPAFRVMVELVSRVRSCTPPSAPDTLMSTPRTMTAEGRVMEPRAVMVSDAESSSRDGE
jgi:hypothetical protein